MKPVTIKLTHKVTEDDITNLFASAMQGSAYWARDLVPAGKGGKYLEDNMLDGFNITDSDTDKIHTVTPSMIKRALKEMADKHRKHWQDMVDGNDDATTADVFMQLCVFGTVIYG